MNSVKVGVVGCGYWGTKHIVNLRRLGVNVVTCDVDGTQDYKSSDDMYRHEQLDAVTICTSHQSLVTEALKAINHRVPALVEKPLATNSFDAWKIKAASEAVNSLVMPGFIERFNANLTSSNHTLIRKGPPFKDRDLIWDLLIHDIDLARFLHMEVATFDCAWSTQKRRTFHDDGDSLYRELKHFLRCVKGFEKPLVTVDDAVQAVIIAENVSENASFS